jgi:hypothetical protein
VIAENLGDFVEDLVGKYQSVSAGDDAEQKIACWPMRFLGGSDKNRGVEDNSH